MLTEFDEIEARPPRPRTAARVAWEWVRFLLTLAILALALRSLVVAPFNIPSRSMTPTLLVGDYLFAAKWPYGYSRYSFPFSPGFIEGRIGGGRPQRGDIVVFRSPADPDSDYVKRVIGLPGDRVRMVDGRLFINGEEMPRTRIADFLEPVGSVDECPDIPGGRTEVERSPEDGLVCRTPRYRETLPGGISYPVLDVGDTTADDTAELAVPAGHYFLLGDDRDRSADSRFVPRRGGGIGMVPEENIVGRVLVLFWSTDGSAHWYDPSSWFGAARWSRIGRSF